MSQCCVLTENNNKPIKYNSYGQHPAAFGYSLPTAFGYSVFCKRVYKLDRSVLLDLNEAQEMYCHLTVPVVTEY